jgi:hypothetical protein
VRFKDLLHRAKTSGSPATELSGARAANPPLAQTEELQEAGAELTEAAKSSKVMNFHACTRSGVPWGQDRATVRLLAGILRDYPVDSSRDAER